ncbi:amidohydrolase family protein [Nonomuraea sp. NPDC004580]|uniref:amidohydrolase family protein n=1 Tax=Nonomuraea sp. NPDC004580 TaxID=3154552 RepID=UPI0033A4BC54
MLLDRLPHQVGPFEQRRDVVGRRCGIHDLVNQVTASGRPLGPEEALTPEQALRAYTEGSAYAVHEEHLKGTLGRGRLADFAVLSDDLLAVDPATIRDITVIATAVSGRLVHDVR